MLRTFKGYSDCGHGWAKVPRELLTELNILNEISSYSYQLGQYVYLEEDCDLSKFFEAYLAKTGKEPKFNMSYSASSQESRIRGYENFDANSITPLASEIKIGLKVSIHSKKYEVIGRNVKKYIVRLLENGAIYGVKLNQMRLIRETK